MKTYGFTIALILSLVLVSPEAMGGGSIAVELVAEGLTAPNTLIEPDDGSGRLFVTDQIGQIRVIDSDGTLLPTPLLDISSRMVELGAFGPGSFDERGLLGLASHPDFVNNGKFYVYYSAPRDADTTISFEEIDIPHGDSDFMFQDIHFLGGIVGTQLEPPLYCTGDFSYEVFADGTATITFPEPVAMVRFFFVHRPTDSPGTITAFDADGNPRSGAIPSNPATFRCDPDNFVTIEDGFPMVGIKSLELQAGPGVGLTLFLDDLEVFNFNHQSRISEFTISKADPNIADPASERVLLEIDEPNFNHDAGMLAFGPDDGFLYISLGDGGNANDTGFGHNPDIGNAQDTSSLLGTILRIDVDTGDPFGIPIDNPFVGVEGRDEIWAYGLRNPFRFSFDMGGTHQLFCGDVGQDLFEEVSIVEKGQNMGWNIREGLHCFDPDNPGDPPDVCPDTGPNGEPLIDPIIEYSHSGAEDEPQGIAVQGGFIYRGSEFTGLVGRYVFGDWSRGPFGGPIDGSLFIATDVDAPSWELEEPTISNVPEGRLKRFVLGFGQDRSGEVYACTSVSISPNGDTGAVFRIVPSIGDLDADLDIDRFDFASFLDCFTGPGGGPIDPGCERADGDGDNDVDFADFATIQRNFTGP